MGIMVYSSLLWVLQDLYHQPYVCPQAEENCPSPWQHPDGAYSNCDVAGAPGSVRLGAMVMIQTLCLYALATPAVRKRISRNMAASARGMVRCVGGATPDKVKEFR